MSHTTYTKVLGAVALLSGVACGSQQTSDLISGNGRIEANEVRVASRLAGRTREVRVEEGDPVKQGQLLVEIDNDEWEARLRQALAETAAARTTVAQAQSHVNVLEHHAQTAQQNFIRMSSLYETGAASAQQRDQAENALREVEGQLEVARSSIEQARAHLEAAQATVEVTRTQLAETDIFSPLDGVVLLRLVEEGEVVQPGQPLLIIIDPENLFLKVYVSEEDIGKVRVGNPVRVRIDAFPDRVFEGLVSEIAQQAEFTPRDIHMPEERTELVFAVKVSLAGAQGYLKPGMFADAGILWREGEGDGEGDDT